MSILVLNGMEEGQEGFPLKELSGFFFQRQAQSAEPGKRLYMRDLSIPAAYADFFSDELLLTANILEGISEVILLTQLDFPFKKSWKTSSSYRLLSFYYHAVQNDTSTRKLPQIPIRLIEVYACSEIAGFSNNFLNYPLMPGVLSDHESGLDEHDLKYFFQIFMPSSNQEHRSRANLKGLFGDDAVSLWFAEQLLNPIPDQNIDLNDYNFWFEQADQLLRSYFPNGPSVLRVPLERSNPNEMRLLELRLVWFLWNYHGLTEDLFQNKWASTTCDKAAVKENFERLLPPHLAKLEKIKSFLARDISQQRLPEAESERVSCRPKSHFASLESFKNKINEAEKELDQWLGKSFFSRKREGKLFNKKREGLIASRKSTWLEKWGLLAEKIRERIRDLETTLQKFTAELRSEYFTSLDASTVVPKSKIELEKKLFEKKQAEELEKWETREKTLLEELAAPVHFEPFRLRNELRAEAALAECDVALRFYSKVLSIITAVNFLFALVICLLAVFIGYSVAQSENFRETNTLIVHLSYVVALLVLFLFTWPFSLHYFRGKVLRALDQLRDTLKLLFGEYYKKAEFFQAHLTRLDEYNAIISAKYALEELIRKRNQREEVRSCLLFNLNALITVFERYKIVLDGEDTTGTATANFSEFDFSKDVSRNPLFWFAETTQDTEGE